jgi:hypothetical protein
MCIATRVHYLEVHSHPRDLKLNLQGYKLDFSLVVARLWSVASGGRRKAETAESGRLCDWHMLDLPCRTPHRGVDVEFREKNGFEVQEMWNIHSQERKRDRQSKLLKAHYFAADFLALRTWFDGLQQRVQGTRAAFASKALNLTSHRLGSKALDSLTLYSTSIHTKIRAKQKFNGKHCTRLATPSSILRSRSTIGMPHHTPFHTNPSSTSKPTLPIISSVENPTLTSYKPGFILHLPSAAS